MPLAIRSLISFVTRRSLRTLRTFVRYLLLSMSLGRITRMNRISVAPWRIVPSLPLVVDKHLLSGTVACIDTRRVILITRPRRTNVLNVTR